MQAINRSRQPALVLGDEHLRFLNLKAPLPIADIDDFRMSLLHGVRLEFVLAEQAALPELTQRRLLHAQARLDRKRRVLSLQLARLCRDGKVLKAPELAELVLQYLNAGMARRALAERAQR
ncbi:peptidase M48, Ste24p [Pseudomonas sp. KNUC1026]|uniref:peptidase M48, Ste24p n=1 Tax=Pseudomonas sp. KNUC1026 TaxID=2893890 RepID=UPI001F431B81|nr:peptidase M48, Ste24p [Pseudomonas sp. KNUC1026]UFH50633.1 peptidase M48, Ste24p [Pseudomonas sp. KNUC1026]